MGLVGLLCPVFALAGRSPHLPFVAPAACPVGVSPNRSIAPELQRDGWCEQDLQARSKNDLAKLEIAARLRTETTLSIKDFAGRVPLGTSKTANMKLHDPLRRSPAYDPAQAQLAF